MRLTEILRKSSTGYQAPAAPVLFNPQLNDELKPLHGTLKFYYENEDDVITIQLVNDDVPFEPTSQYHQQLKGRFGKLYRVLADLTLNSASDMFPFRAVQVDSIHVAKDFQNKGLARELYKLVFNTTKSSLVAGDQQTPGGRRNWVSLLKMPEVEVIGYIKLLPGDLEKPEIMEAVLERGGQYEGKSGKYHFFLFESFISKSGDEVTIDHENIIQLYRDIAPTNNLNANVGLIARWIR